MSGRAQHQPMFHPHSVVAARRRGRVAFGVVLATSVVVVPLACIGLGVSGLKHAGLYARQMAGLGIPVLFAVATAAYLLRWAFGAVAVRLGRGVSARGRAISSPAAPGAAFADDHAEASRLERGSLLWPAFGLGMITPLASHSLVGAMFGVSAADIGDWVRVSVWVVGLAHLVFAGTLAREAKRMAESPDTWSLGRATARVVGYSTLAGCVPGAIFIGIPPLLVAMTGSVLAPLILAGLRDRLTKEREMLDPGHRLRERVLGGAATVTVAA